MFGSRNSKPPPIHRLPRQRFFDDKTPPPDEWRYGPGGIVEPVKEEPSEEPIEYDLVRRKTSDPIPNETEEEPVVTAPDVAALENALRERRLLEELAAMLRSLTYGEMMELSAAIWKVRPEGATEISLEALPSTLHRWATAREEPTNDQ